jgi:microsomal epoxide hydrolase
MSVAFTNSPRSATIQPTPFKVSILQSVLDELKTLIKLSKVAPPTYEGSQEDRKYGVTNKWVREAKEIWEKDFDWYVFDWNSRSHLYSCYVRLGASMRYIDFATSFSATDTSLPNSIKPISFL